MKASLPTIAAALSLAISACSAGFGEAENAVRHDMKDPDSAQFRDLRYCADEGKSVIMGQYNGKNSYGAYNGFAPFYYEGGKTELASGSGLLASKCVAQMEARTAANQALIDKVRAANAR